MESLSRVCNHNTVRLVETKDRNGQSHISVLLIAPKFFASRTTDRAEDSPLKIGAVGVDYFISVESLILISLPAF